jgi:hypothetical protein
MRLVAGKWNGGCGCGTWEGPCTRVGSRGAKCERKEKKLATTHEFAKNRVLGGRLRIIDFWRQPRRTMMGREGKTRSRVLVAGVARVAGAP